MKVLVAGGAGYIGSHTVAALLERGMEAVVADNLSTGHRAAVPDRVSFWQGDIRDREFLDRLLEKERPDAAVHFAALSLVGVSMKEPLRYYDNNLSGTCTLLWALAEHGVRRVVFSSTAAVYGEPERTPILEGDPTRPTNPYGETKLAMERMFHWADLAHGIKHVALRYFNACGAAPGGEIGEDHAPETHLIPLVLQVPLGKRESIQVFGTDYPTPDGTCVRDYIHVCDLAQAHVLALEYLMAGGESDVFNLGNGKGFSVREVILAAQKAVGQPIPTLEAARRPGDPARLVAGSQRAGEVLGWSPRYLSLEEMIASAWNWHRSHPDGFGGR